MIFSGMTSSNTAEYKFYLKSGVIKFQFIIIIIFALYSKIYIKDDKELLENYRPVSTLAVFGKIFEKIISSWFFLT